MGTGHRKPPCQIGCSPLAGARALGADGSKCHAMAWGQADPGGIQLPGRLRVQHASSCRAGDIGTHHALAEAGREAAPETRNRARSIDCSRVGTPRPHSRSVGSSASNPRPVLNPKPNQRARSGHPPARETDALEHDLAGVREGVTDAPPVSRSRHRSACLSQAACPETSGVSRIARVRAARSPEVSRCCPAGEDLTQHEGGPRGLASIRRVYPPSGEHQGDGLPARGLAVVAVPLLPKRCAALGDSVMSDAEEWQSHCKNFFGSA